VWKPFDVNFAYRVAHGGTSRLFVEAEIGQCVGSADDSSMSASLSACNWPFFVFLASSFTHVCLFVTCTHVILVSL
jgi:hypothetical protein